MKKNQLFSRLSFLFFLVLINVPFAFSQETSKQDSINLNRGIYLQSPLGWVGKYNAKTKQYVLQKEVNGRPIGLPIYLTREEYLEALLSENISEYYKQKSQSVDIQYRNRFEDIENKRTEFAEILPSLQVNNKIFKSIFGGNKIELVPKGYASIDLGVLYQNLENPQLLPQNRKNLAVDLQQQIRMGLIGKVGENLQLEANYDTQAGFAFENRMNISWRPNQEGGEDSILQTIEFGNVSLPLNTSLITGVQSLFGAKAKLKFGNTYITTLFSQQESESKHINVEKGNVISRFKIYAKDYEANQHYFLSQFFRNNYDKSLSSYPFISSQINISRLEVWVIDRGNANPENRRAILGLRDLGENNSIPANAGLYNQISSLPRVRDASLIDSSIASLNLRDSEGKAYHMGEHYLVHENVRLLNASEYQFYPSLGYISLNQKLNDNELLAVSFQYTLTNQPGKVYSVGEFSDQQSSLLIAKLIKSNTSVDVTSPMWKLMMKNIYSLDTYQLSSEDFRLNILYKNTDLGTADLNYLPDTSVEDKTLLQVLNMDRLNRNGKVQEGNNNQGDGLFDYLPGITIDQQNGKIIFTTIEPFGKTIENKISRNKDKYVINELYTQLPITFEQNEKANRYFLQGQYKSSGTGGIPLGAFNVPRGSVKVSTNGRELLEGVDYTVDYQLGRVNIINQTLLNNGANIQISLENRSTFNMQTKRLWGLNVEHRFSDNFILGGTFMNYQEKPLGSVTKAQYNDEPVSNSIIGANILYNSESEWLTRMVDKIPFVNTDAKSNISFAAEAAYLMPGTNNSINNQSYIDDFENSQTSISLMSPNAWQLAATPISSTALPNHDFDPSIFNPDDFSINYNRRLITWYNVDPRFYKQSGSGAISNSDLSKHNSRRVSTLELFSGRDMNAGTTNYTSTFDISYFPKDRGPYNLNPNWNTENQRDLWGGLTRALPITNLVQNNVEYVEFWMMDPYLDGLDNNPEAKILLHLGNVSEDLLRDGKLFYENGLNASGGNIQNNRWGKQPTNQAVLYSFDKEEQNRRMQDVGYNGLTDEEEKLRLGYSNFATSQNEVTGEIDPAADNFVYYMDKAWENHPRANNLPERYKYFRNPQGNSPAGSLEAATAVPDAEDVNQDYNLDRIENYNQYTLRLAKENLNLNNPFIVDEKATPILFENGQRGESKWYLFRIPLSDYDEDAGAASQNVLNNARFMRLILKGFKNTTTLRFGSFDLVRSDWVKYQKNLYPNVRADEGTQDIDNTNLSLGIVNIEENSTAIPPYVTPPGIQREEIQSSVGLQRKNEASMVLNLADLATQDARAIFKNTTLDLRRYKKLKMFTHVHAGENGTQPNNNLKLFIRLGSDLVENYYEYEIPLEYSPITANSPTSIWPESNSIDIDTEIFKALKKEYISLALNERFGKEAIAGSGKYVYIKGKPSLGSISSLMIGVRNTGSFNVKNAIVWINELRLAEIDNEGGYAGKATLNMNLSDLAQITATGNISTSGFGAIDRRPVERQQEEVKAYAFNANVNVDKFLPEKWGLKIPLNYSIQEEFIDPKYNPLDDDIEFNEDPRKEQLQKIVRTYNKRTSIAFNNIRKIKTSPKAEKHFYNIENFSISALYRTDYFRDLYTAYDLRKDLNASLNYNYQFKGLNYEPFKNWRMVQDSMESSKYLQWIKEVNINPIPSRIGFRTDIFRTYNQQLFRDLSGTLSAGNQKLLTRPIFSNNFLFNWRYNIGFDLSKSLRIDYNAATKTLADLSPVNAKKNLIFKDLLSIGRPVNYSHELRINYRTPLHLFPYLQWLQADVGYNALYDWRTRLSNHSNVNNQFEDLGNLAQNSRTWNVNGNMNFEELYSQFEIFKRLDAKKIARERELDSLQNLYSNLAGKEQGFRKINNLKVKLRNKYSFKEYLLLGAQSIKRAQFSYNKNQGIILPGLLSEPNFFGLGKNNSGPDFGFIFGSQRDLRRKAVENGWITGSEYLTEPYTSTLTEDFTANLQIEPSPSLIIDLNGRRNLIENFYQSGYNVVLPTNEYGFEKAFGNHQQNFTTSIISLTTATKSKDFLFDRLVKNAQKISASKGRQYDLQDTDGDGFVQGFGIANADVLVPAFLYTYQGIDVKERGFNFKKNIPLPNWNIRYTGLTRTPFLSKYFDQFELTHNYRSTYTVGGVQSNIDYFSNPYPLDSDGSIITDSSGNPVSGLNGNQNLYSENIYGSVSMIESFAPLVGISIRLRNQMQIKAEYNRDRFINLSLSNFTLTEDYSNEYVLGFGYLIPKVKFNMRYMGSKKTFEGDVNIRADLSLRDSETSIRRIIEKDLQVNGGQQIFSLRINAEYLLTDNFNVSLYYEQLMTKYKISTAYPLSTVRAGIRATFSFGN